MSARMFSFFFVALALDALCFEVGFFHGLHLQVNAVLLDAGKESEKAEEDRGRADDPQEWIGLKQVQRFAVAILQTAQQQGNDGEYKPKAAPM
ncbi:MAG: hypothetical protein R2856_15000 [Caldilineaceae bacterium]